LIEARRDLVEVLREVAAKRATPRARLPSMAFDLTDEEILAHPVDQLALRVLEDYANNPATNGSGNTWMRMIVQISPKRSDEAVEALSEAWLWLQNQGLVAQRVEKATTTAGAVFVTRRGRRVLAEGLAGARAEARLNIDLHPLIEAKARSPYLQGNFDRAVFDAMKAIEVRVKEPCGNPTAKDGRPLYGVDVMRHAFGDQGPLQSPAEDRGERTGRMDLFAGAIALFKNPGSHKDVEYSDPTEATEAILLADLLMRILDRVEQDELSGTER
jgi:uncharacterized protein (TIGR02391 family)